MMPVPFQQQSALPHRAGGIETRNRPIARTENLEFVAVNDISFSVGKGETVGLLGSNLLIDDLPTVLKANQLCNRLGLDTISTGGAIGSCVMESW
jgi:aldehyde:ferredoxin oxidoreductase